jgi:hypothetical protein
LEAFCVDTPFLDDAKLNMQFAWSQEIISYADWQKVSKRPSGKQPTFIKLWKHGERQQVIAVHRFKKFCNNQWEALLLQFT